MSTPQSGLTRRAIVRGLGATAAVGVAGTTSTSVAAEQESGPHVELVQRCFYARVETDTLPESVTVYTTDGTTHAFTDLDGTRLDDIGVGEFGYGGLDNVGQIDGWHGLVERAEVETENETVEVTADGDCPTVDVNCTFVEANGAAFGDFRMQYEHATIQYEGVPDGGPVGSPGRVLQRASESGSELRVEPSGDCEPEGELGVTFDCTSVTVHPHEFVNLPSQFRQPSLEFADGTTEQLGAGGEEFEAPATFEGTGEHAGKVISSLTLENGAGGICVYRNPDEATCEPAEGETDEADDDEAGGDEADDEEASDDEANGDETASDDTTDSDASGDETSGGDANGEDTGEGPSADESDDTPTETPDDETTQTATPDDTPTETPSEETTQTATPDDSSTSTSTATPEETPTSTSTPAETGTGGSKSGEDAGSSLLDPLRTFWWWLLR